LLAKEICFSNYRVERPATLMAPPVRMSPRPATSAIHSGMPVNGSFELVTVPVSGVAVCVPELTPAALGGALLGVDAFGLPALAPSTPFAVDGVEAVADCDVDGVAVDGAADVAGVAVTGAVAGV
jgi:hypothetical protein